MSISTLESATSRRMLDEMQAEQDRRTAAVECLREAFLLATVCRDSRALAWFAPRATAWSLGKPEGTRIQHFWEVMHDALDAKDFAERAMQVLMEAAAGRTNQTDAQELLEEMAACWADSHADEVKA
jgi:hypothetical protein